VNMLGVILLLLVVRYFFFNSWNLQ
jgi:hypothetical protein